MTVMLLCNLVEFVMNLRIHVDGKNDSVFHEILSNLMKRLFKNKSPWPTLVCHWSTTIMRHGQLPEMHV